MATFTINLELPGVLVKSLFLIKPFSLISYKVLFDLLLFNVEIKIKSPERNFWCPYKTY